MPRPILFLIALLAAPAFAQPKPTTRADVEKEREVEFAALDTNRDGNADADEIGARFRSLADQAVAQARIDRATSFREMDKNGDGKVSLAEYEAAIPLPDPKVPPTAEVLKMFDADADGRLTPAEFAAPSLSMFDRGDLNRDGVLSVSEQEAAAKRP